MHSLAKSRASLQMQKDEPATEETSASAFDYTLGIYQSIGYKEFREYLVSEDANSASEKLFNEAVEATKTSTRQYAKRQVSWLKNKLLPAFRAAHIQAKTQPGEGTPDPVPMYLLDATDVSEGWSTNVKDKAIGIMDAFLSGEHLPDPRSLSEVARTMLSVPDKLTDVSAVLRARRKKVCPVCTMDPTRPFMVEEGAEWEAHQRTKTHRYSLGVRNGTRKPRQKNKEPVQPEGLGREPHVEGADKS